VIDTRGGPSSSSILAFKADSEIGIAFMVMRAGG
jgi:hypothetical protein